MKQLKEKDNINSPTSMSGTSDLISRQEVLDLIKKHCPPYRGDNQTEAENDNRSNQ